MRISAVLSRRCIVLFLLGAADQFLQFTAVCGNEVLFKLAAAELHGDIVVIGIDEAGAAFKMGNLHDLSFREVHDRLDTLRLLIFQVENDFCFAVIDDALTAGLSYR